MHRSLSLLAMMAVAGCGSGDLASPSALPAAVEEFQSGPSLPKLTTGQLARAIANRSRIERARGGMPEGVSRRYDQWGRPVAEHQIVNGKMVTRPVTMPADLAARDIRSFLSDAPASQLITVAKSAVATDTVDTVIYTTYDSTWTTTSSGYSMVTHDTETETSTFVGDVYWSDTTETEDLREVSSAVVVMCIEGEGCDEVMPTEADLAEVAADVDSLMDATGMLRLAPDDYSTSRLDPARLLSLPAFQLATCADLANAAIRSAIAGVAWAALAARLASLPGLGAATRIAVRRAIQYSIATMVRYEQWKSCME